MILGRGLRDDTCVGENPHNVGPPNKGGDIIPKREDCGGKRALFSEVKPEGVSEEARVGGVPNVHGVQ